jgi:carboxylesterase type B
MFSLAKFLQGGGYGQGNASTDDLSEIIVSNNNSFIGVTIQYRVRPGNFKCCA